MTVETKIYIFVKEFAVMQTQTQNDVRVTIRVDKGLKERADALFDRLGLNMTTALNVFLRKAVDEEGIPFAVSTKSVGFGVGYSADDITNAFGEAVRDEIAEAQRNGHAVARYDAVEKRAFLEYPDGKREYVSR
jgi:addiction module RelB/DinJ family antitoxin